MPRASARSPEATPPTTAIAVGYLRRSTDRQEQSIPDQRRAIEAFAVTHGLRLVRFYTDDAISGTSTAERPAFQKMVADARSGVDGARFTRVVVYDVKRFGRIDNDEAGYYRHLLRSCGVEVLYASENFSGDASDDLLRPVKQWQARQESKDLAKVTIRGLVSKATSGSSVNPSRDHRSGGSRGGGGWMGGAPPFGYDLRYESSSGQFIFTVRHQPDGSKLLLDANNKSIRTIPRGETLGISKKDRAHLVPSDPARVATVREVFRMYTEEGKGYKAIAEALNRAGTPTARGKAWSSNHAGLWSVGSVRAILNNPAYTGDLVWNRRTDARFFRITGEGHAVARSDTPGVARRLSHNDERDWMVTSDAHEPLVSRRVYQHAQDRLKERSREAQRLASERPRLPREPENGWAGPTSPKARFLLSGLCRCARCGSRYEGHGAPTGTRNDDGPREKVWSYACGGYIRHGRSTCLRGGVAQGTLERLVVDAVREYYRRFRGDAGHRALCVEVDRLLLGEGAVSADAKAKLTKRLERIDRSVRNLLDNLSASTKEMGERRLLELDRERAECAREIAAIESLSATKREARSMADEAHAYIAAMVDALDCWDGSTDRTEAITTALRRCIHDLRIDAANASAVIHLRTLPVLASGPAFQHTEEIAIAIAR
jgi:DNA invertase Pin-like site-specific DNA recombinase